MVAYSEELAARICAEMAKGRSLRSVCRDDGMPDESAVRLWAAEDRNGFAPHYARAREAQIEALSEDLLDIADSTTGDPQRDKLRVDTRKWIMSKIAPKKYGDKLDLEHSGQVQISRIEHVIVKPQ